MTNALRLQTEYMGTRRSGFTIHGVPMDINEDRLGGFFAFYVQVEEVVRILNKSGVPSTEFSIQVILDKTKF